MRGFHPDAWLVCSLGHIPRPLLSSPGKLPITRQGVAKHLAALAEAGLVEASREGRELRYRLTPAPFAAAALWMAALGAEWDERLEALQRVLGRSPAKLGARRGG